MPIIKVILDDSELQIPFTTGTTIRDVLHSSGIYLHSECGGKGTCGRCIIQVHGEIEHKLTDNEKTHLTKDQQEHGIRLACQFKPSESLNITIEYQYFNSKWKILHEKNNLLNNDDQVNLTNNKKSLPLGVAIDIGTTQIRLSICDMSNQKRILIRSVLNPQIYFGADVLSRLVSASESEQNANEISLLVIEAIAKILADIELKENIDLQQIGKIMIVGNTAMLTLLTKKNYELLLNPDYWTQDIDCNIKNTKHLNSLWKVLLDAQIGIAPPLAGFVGSDLLAGVIASELLEKTAGTLLIDFGTNSEIALWDGNLLRVTSAAGGPAFEGCGLSCGMPAIAGAIYEIEMLNDSDINYYNVIENINANGFCGSGIVDIIANLINLGILKKNGNFIKTFETGFTVLAGNSNITIKKRDVDLFQRAKAAVGAGVKFLINDAGMKINDIKRICICGEFGRFLNIKNAQTIGLIPNINEQNIELCGNTALLGSEHLLFSKDFSLEIEELKHKAKILNLANFLEYDTMFIENLFLQPMKLE